jgi:hypothetical protein
MIPNGTYEPQNQIKKRSVVTDKTHDSWTAEKVILNAQYVVKPKTVLPVIGVEKNINDIRISLNKISNKNYETQKEIILNHMLIIDDDESLQKVAQFIFDVVSSNKFYCELYADLFKELVNKTPIFLRILYEHVSEYKSSLDNLKYIDSTIDYDGYCNYVKNNENRRAMATFFMMLSARNIINNKIILSIIDHFQTSLLKLIDIKDNVLECEEISEIIFIFISIGNSNDLLIIEEEWNDKIIPCVKQISKFKVKEHSSLSSRIIFKQMDLNDFVSKRK